MIGISLTTRVLMAEDTRTIVSTIRMLELKEQLITTVMTGHNMERCFKLNGYPPGYKASQQQPQGFKRFAHFADSVSEESSFIFSLIQVQV